MQTFDKILLRLSILDGEDTLIEQYAETFLTIPQNRLYTTHKQALMEHLDSMIAKVNRELERAAWLELPVICSDCMEKIGETRIPDNEENRKLLSIKMPCPRGCDE